MTLLEELAEERSNAVLYTSVSVTIEKVASEIAQELLRDPTFRAELKALARQSFGRAVRNLRKNGRRRRRKTRA